MYIISKTRNGSGGYSAIQTWSSSEIPEGYAEYPDEFFNEFYKTGKNCAGFVDLEFTEDGKKVINVTWNDDRYEAYLATLPPREPAAQEEKCKTFASVCGETINNGADVTFEDGTVLHYDYTIEDQANISEMVNAINAGVTEFPYHAKGESCRTYTAKEIVTIYAVLSMLKTTQITYQNQLKAYVNSLTVLEEIEAVNYGDALTGEYLENYNTLIAEAEVQMKKVVDNLLKVIEANTVTEA